MALRSILAAALMLARPVAATEFWVAHDGNDTSPGSRSKPFATLERLREAVRQVKRNGKLPNDGITVFIRGGDYYRTNGFILDAEDSGTSESPITWREAPGQRVRLLGGKLLTGFKPVTDSSVLKRLEKAAQRQVLQLNLKDRGITDFGEMKSRGFGRSSAVAQCELFFDHRPMTLARWPNTGEFAKIAGYPAAADRKDEHGGNLGELPGGFLYAGDRPSRWQDTSEVWVHGYWAYDWANSYEKVAAVDLSQHLVKTAAPHGLYGFS